MKIVDAYWEQRNLGVTCVELIVDQGDTVESIIAELAGLKAQYQVVKMPVGRYDLMREAEKAGFSFIEGSLQVVHNLQNIKSTGVLQRFNDSIIYEEMSQTDVDRLYSEIRKGIFRTDRIYLDAAFAKEQAAERYIYWLQDELKRGGQLYKLVYKADAIGFFIFQETPDGGSYPFLSGLYESTKTPGLGNILLHKIIKEAARRGLKNISSFISTNNLPVVKVHIAEGFTITNINYVYIKHGNNKRSDDKSSKI